MGDPNEFRFMHADSALRFRDEVAAVLVDRDAAAVSLDPGANSTHPWRVYLGTSDFKSGVGRKELEVMVRAAARTWIFGDASCFVAWARDMP